MSVDLHIHSTASDGTYTPEAIIDLAVARGLTAVSICDHDSMGATAAAQAAAAGRIRYLPGVEVSSVRGGQELHILGYFARDDYAPLRDELRKIREERAARIGRTVARLNELGVPLAVADVEAAAQAEPGHDIALGRPHVALALVRRGLVANTNEAFDLYLRRGRPAYMERYRLQPERAVTLIREAGGLPVLAHPGLVKNDGLIEPLVRQGLGGLEAYHTSHSEADARRYVALAERLGLYVTGGTDCHGPSGSYPVDVGEIDVPDECATKLLAWAEKRG
jgi:predicted metal-dependent phosphoesterase TrpH